MMEMVFNPFDAWKLGFEMTRMGVEAQAVIAMRMAGMMGLWATNPAENNRMVREKQVAAAASMMAVGRAAMAGESATNVMRAGLKPIGRKTASNARRLARLGPQLPSGA
ncbi:hypothetical protein [Phaeovulum sp. W22_SRMD_FR3]|uniref:hypothetical protein n=1 Tax=Phaeovulum sp. W22_SRMD_FR3 TaxID=3240274 RepID=UPI003F9D34F1